MTTPNAFSIASSLHGNPSAPPQLGIKIKNKAGETLDVANPRATRALVSLMDMEAVIGGAACHFGGPAAFAEMMSALHGYMFDKSRILGKQWHEKFHFINDAGHCENGIYALKANYKVAGLDFESLKHFRSIESGLTGHGEAHLFPEGVYVSNGPLGSGLPQAQGLAAAESYTSAPRTTVVTISDGACMEGEAKEAFAAIPGLAAQKKMGPFVCLVSDNNTKLSGRIDEDAFSMQPTFQGMSHLGWDVRQVEDGHDLQSMYLHIEAAMEKATEDPTRPVLLWVRTIKGKGVEKTEKSSSGGHGFPLKDPKDIKNFVGEIYAGEDIPDSIGSWVDQLMSFEKSDPLPPRFSGDRMKVQKGISEALIEKYEKGFPIVSVSSDLQGSTGVAGFRSKFPQACFEVGVAESNMISMAVGLSKQGYIPIVDTFSQFAVTKGALPLIMSGLSQGPMIGIFSHTGFQDAADGASHQALTYFAMTSSIPNVDVYVLSCRQEAQQLLSQAIDKFAEDRKSGEVPRTSIFFLGRENYLGSYGSGVQYELGKAQVISQKLEQGHRSVTLVTAGPMLENTLLAQNALAEDKGIGSIVVHCSAVNHPDLDTIGKCLANTNGYCVTVEDHRTIGGFGSRLAHALVTEGYACKMRTMGIGDHFGRSAYNAHELYRKFGLGVLDIVKTAEDLF